MTKLTGFMDNDGKGLWANIRMDNGDPCWIGIAKTGITVKKSRIGLFGAKLYEEKNLFLAARKAAGLGEQFPNDLTPPEMRNPVLKSLVNAVLHCRTIVEVTKVLNEEFINNDEKMGRMQQSRDSLPQEFDLNNPQHVSIIDDVREQYGALLAEDNSEFADCRFKPASLLPYPKEVIKKALGALIDFSEGRRDSLYLDPSLREEVDSEGINKMAGICIVTLMHLDDFLEVPADELPSSPVENLAFGFKFQDEKRVKTIGVN